MKKLSILAIAAVALLAGQAGAAVATVSDSMPAVDGMDIANTGPENNTDKWWTGGASQVHGQTFVPGGDVLFNGLTFEIQDNQSGEPTKVYEIRVGTFDKTDPADTSTWTFNEILSESATQDTESWIGTTKATDTGVAPMPFMTWTLDSPVSLSGGVEYAVDVALESSTSGWQTGIPYIKNSSTDYADGVRYYFGTQGETVGPGTGGDRVIHLDMSTGIPEPASLALLGLAGAFLVNRRRR